MSQVSYTEEWRNRIDAFLSKNLPTGARVTDRATFDAIYDAFPGYLLFCFCENYRRKNATPWQSFEGFAPAHLRLIEKHHWLPEQVFALSEDQLLLLLHHDLIAVKLPLDAHQLIEKYFQHHGIHDLKLAPPDVNSPPQ
ncbi:hypothetical protein [Pseudomonas capsici]|uniref:hypothetical protein n=1 Tax=Pseudomonas capsici TaxID=2810614 RepID=UPI0021F1B387|nr:hypothetical protein [Pseudomonas capsici]MCV4285068.1 hypothetical protein [Pseudomonas capsici]